LLNSKKSIIRVGPPPDTASLQRAALRRPPTNKVRRRELLFWKDFSHVQGAFLAASTAFLVNVNPFRVTAGGAAMLWTRMPTRI
jgi:hypothetical protein